MSSKKIRMFICLSMTAGLLQKHCIFMEKLRTLSL